MSGQRVLTLPGPLSQQLEMLWRQQTDEWARLREGVACLAQARTRSFKVGLSRVAAQCNPARLSSASAKVDPQSLANRPCFLCEANLPAEQQALVYRDEWRILCNPAPLVVPHFTVATVAHRPQRLNAAMGVLLDLARDANGAYTVFYNGPMSGASAPDHLHLQISPAGALPFEMELAEQIAGCNREKGYHWIEWIRTESVRVGLTRPSHRSTVVLIGEDREKILQELNRITGAIGEIHPAESEPMLNLFVCYVDERWLIWLFPRARHRPSFYGQEPADYLISPGAVDLAGILIVPRPEDFDRLDAAVIQRIYDEVLLSPGQMARLKERLA